MHKISTASVRPAYLWYKEAYLNCLQNLPLPSNNMDSASAGWQGRGPCGEGERMFWRANWRIHPLGPAAYRLQMQG